MSTDEYTPSGEDERIAHAYAEVIYHGSEGMVSREEGVAEFYAYLAAHDARVAREALDGLSAWLGDLAEKHPARSAHVPLVQGHITRYTTDNYPEETP